MNLLDQYLNQYEITRYQLAKVSGISNGRWGELNKKGLEHYSVRHLRAIAMVIGKPSHEVLLELEELVQDDLNGFRAILDKYQVTDPNREQRLKTLLQKLDAEGYHLTPFTFNRLEEENPSKEDILKAMDNTVITLEEIIEKIESEE